MAVPSILTRMSRVRITESELNKMYSSRKVVEDNITYDVEDDGVNSIWFCTHYYFRGQLHRLKGPAIQWAKGVDEWYYYGKKINCFSQEEFERLIKLKEFW